MNRKVLILTDGKPGHENQSKALANALGYDYDVAWVKFSSGFDKFLSYVFDKFGWISDGLFKTGKLLKGTYAAVIGTGSGTFYPAKVMAKKMGVKCGVVLYPRGYKLEGFDCIMAPKFDRPEKAYNVVEIPCNLVNADGDFYEKEIKAFLARHQPAKQAIGIIIGGPNKCATMSAEWLKGHLDKIIADNYGCEFWVTTSRRTPKEIEDLLMGYPFDYRLIFSKDQFNPIPAFVCLASKLFVTAESTGMISEACMFGEAEVHVMDNLKPGDHKFRRFVNDLKRTGYINGNKKLSLDTEFALAHKLMGL